jgi:hypothetical protein
VWPNYNVIGIVDMDLRFTYVGAELVGSCHDMSVLRDCMVQANYPHPPAGMMACYVGTAYIVVYTL